MGADTSLAPWCKSRTSTSSGSCFSTGTQLPAPTCTGASFRTRGTSSSSSLALAPMLTCRPGSRSWSKATSCPFKRRKSNPRKHPGGSGFYAPLHRKLIDRSVRADRPGAGRRGVGGGDRAPGSMLAGVANSLRLNPPAARTRKRPTRGGRPRACGILGRRSPGPVWERRSTGPGTSVARPRGAANRESTIQATVVSCQRGRNPILDSGPTGLTPIPLSKTIDSTRRSRCLHLRRFDLRRGAPRGIGWPPVGNLLAGRRRRLRRPLVSRTAARRIRQ
jgi:hypothetical protein